MRTGRRVGRRYWQAEEVGDRLLINPAWLTPPDTNRTILTLDPGSAFGTGAHATTQLCLEALEKANGDWRNQLPMSDADLAFFLSWRYFMAQSKYTPQMSIRWRLVQPF